MDRNWQSQNALELLPALLQKIISSPEFKYAQGSISERLEQVCYYHLGSIRYPAKLLLSHFFQMMAEKFEIALVVQDIKLRIINAPVHKIPGDGAILAQDVNQIMGPMEITKDDLVEEITALHGYRPRKLGEVLVSSPHWCKSQYLLEAVVYSFDCEEITNEQVINSTMQECFLRCKQLKITKLAMEPLGIRHSKFSCRSFVKSLRQTLIKCIGHLGSLNEIIIASDDSAQIDDLKKALTDVLNVP